MTRLIATIALVLALPAALAACGDASEPMDEDTARAALAERETAWLASYGDADSSRMSGILAEGFFIILADGTKQTAQDLLSGLDQPGRTAGEVNHYTENREIVLNGDTAVLSGTYVAPGLGQRADIRMHYTDTWIYRDGEWKVLASRLSSLR